jgi:metallophosphoesterase (TIGR00282 family)
LNGGSGLNILFIGDIFGNPGRKAVKEYLGTLKRDLKIDFCIANGENSAAGSGITYVIAQELYKYGIDVITMGNHTWSKKEIYSFIENDKRIIRPSNFAPGTPGNGYAIIETQKGRIGILNLAGRVYMDSVDCPFRKADEDILKIKEQTNIIIVDFHAEATSEKIAMGWYLDGRVSAVVGTHTHVQTADEKILDCGTGYITDVGMTGPNEGIIGVDKEIVIEKFLKGLPVKFEVSTGKVQFNAIYLEIEEKKGRVTKIERISRIFDLD